MEEMPIAGCYLISPDIFEDKRGLFYESFNKKLFEETLDQQINFVQDNHSVSKRGVLRGLHFQTGGHAQAKLVRVIKGKVLDVVVDLRANSATFGKHFKVKLEDHDHKSLFIPKGMAHGFLTLSEEAVFTYKCDNFYYKQAESGIAYDDDDLQIDWEYAQEKIVLSEKDKQLPSFKELYP